MKKALFLFAMLFSMGTFAQEYADVVEELRGNLDDIGIELIIHGKHTKTEQVNDLAFKMLSRWGEIRNSLERTKVKELVFGAQFEYFNYAEYLSFNTKLTLDATAELLSEEELAKVIEILAGVDHEAMRGLHYFPHFSRFSFETTSDVLFLGGNLHAFVKRIREDWLPAVYFGSHDSCWHRLTLKLNTKEIASFITWGKDSLPVCQIMESSS